MIAFVYEEYGILHIRWKIKANEYIATYILLRRYALF